MNNTPKPYDSNLPQTIKESSWIIVDNSSEYGMSIVFFNNDEAPADLKFNSFKAFFQDYIDNCFLDYEQKERHINDIKGSATATQCSMEDDFCEDTRKTWQNLVVKAQVIDGFNSMKGHTLDNLIKQANLSLKSIEDDTRYNQEDNQSYRKDPYAYYGVSKKDFL